MEDWISKILQIKIPWPVLLNSLDVIKPFFYRLLLVMMGGGIGSSCRYIISLTAVKLFGPRFAWGTLAVNLSGCFLIGVSFALADRTRLMGPSMRLFFITGFLGGLTTFSTYAYETAGAVKSGTFWVAAANFFANNILGLALVFAGMWLIRSIRP
jgi:fluoride exporter